MKYNVNNIDYEILNEIVLSIYDEHIKWLRPSLANLVTKEFQNGVMNTCVNPPKRSSKRP